MKLVRQYASFLYFFAEAEPIEGARRIGLDPEVVIDALGRTVGPSGERTRAWRAILDRDFGQPGATVSTLDIVAKDVRLAIEQG